MQVFLEAIKFNHNVNLAIADAFNIRKNETETLPLPEWQRGASITADHSVAAYAIKPTQNQTITIQAKFKTSQTGLSKINIQAVDASSPFSISNILGRVKAKEVTFFANGESGFIPFTLEDVRLEERGVGISKVIWRWQFFDNDHNRWSDFAKSTHKIYSVIDVPHDPWSDVYDPNNSQLPWTEVLDVACDWAAGATTVEQAAELITRNVNDLGLTLVGYHGSPAIYALANFKCTKFLELLRGKAGMGSRLNCSDFATIVSTLANILGCKTCQMKLGGDFQTNPIILIGTSYPWRVGFNNHEVAWTGKTFLEGCVFDGCLQLDGDEDPKDPKPFQALLPTNLLFVLGNELRYKHRLDGTNSLDPKLPGGVRRIGSRVPARMPELDPDSWNALEQRYDYKAWKASTPSNIFLTTSLPVNQSAGLQGWEVIDEQDMKFDDGTALKTRLFAVGDSNSLFREDVFECNDWHAARALLLRLLGEYKSTRVERLENPAFADVAFVATDNASALFACSQSVFLISTDSESSSPETGLQTTEFLFDKESSLLSHYLRAVHSTQDAESRT